MNTRIYRPGDEASVAAIWERALPKDPMAPVRLQARILADPAFERAGLLIAEDGGGAPVGFLWAVARPPTGWIVALGVEPARRRAGCGRALVDGGLAYLAGRGCREVVCAGYAPAYFWPGPDIAAHAGAIRLLQRAGFTVAEEVVAMERSLSGIPAPVTPDGVTLSEITLSEMRPHLIVPALEMVSRVFSADWAEALRQAIHAQVPAERIRVAACGEQVAGFAMWGAYDDSLDRFGPFGVDPAVRGRGVGAALLADALAAMARAGCERAWFLWTEPGGAAHRLYRRAGFQVTRRFAIMRRSL